MPAADVSPTEHRRQHHRTWPERIAIAASVLAAVVAFAAAAGLVAGYLVLREREVVQIVNPATQAPAVQAAASDGAAAPSETAPPADRPVPQVPATTTPPTFPAADPEAKNFLVTGADNGACVDPGSRFAGAFGDRDDAGERSDTIMVFRIDPRASRIAVLSFPRDLYVTIAGSGNRARINSAYRRDEPQRLINTIYENFGVVTDHFIQVDFCAFKTLVDAVGGVAVPFDFPARDPNTGLDVPTTGCFRFTGEHALAYVRSRKYEYEDPPGSGEWHDDVTSDLGRISRQQDFLRRVMSRVLAKGPLNPAVAGGLIESATEYVVTDAGLSPAKLLEFAGVLNRVDPAAMVTYQIESSARTVNDAQVLEPQLDGRNMQAVLALFRGETSLDSAPEQSFQTTTSSIPRPGRTSSTAGLPTAPTAPTATPDEDPLIGDATGSPSDPVENINGIVPPRDVTC